MKEWIKTPKTQLKQSTAELTQKELNEENACGFCIFVLTKYQNIISLNSTETEAKNYLDGACRLLPSSELSQQCLDQVATYLPQIINLLRDNADPGVICHVLHLCLDQHLEQQKFDVSQIKIKIVNPEKVKIKTPLQPIQNQKGVELAGKLTATEGMGCEICTIVLNAAKYLVENKVDHEKELKFIEKNLCSRLGDYNQTCTEYLETEGETIIKFLEDEIEPAFICHEFGLCMKSQMNVAQTNPFDLKTRSPSSCQQCKKTMDHVKTMTADDHKDVDILDYIKENMCQNSGDLKYLCSSTIDAYSQTILAIIEQDIKSEQLCELFEVCGAEKKTEEVFYNIDKPQISATQLTSDPNNCVVCQFLMKLLDQELYKNTTEIEIKTALDKVCNLMFPSEYKRQCTKFVETYTDTVIFLIVKQIPPEYICEVIGVCKQNTHIHEFLEHKDQTPVKKVLIGAEEKKINNLSVDPPKPSSECVMCEFAINILSKMIQKNSTKDQLIAAMKNVCDKEMPAQFKDQCNQFVDTYGETIIEMLVQNMNPEMICQEINVCPKPATEMNLLGAEKIYEKLPKEILEKDSVSMVDLKPAKLVKTVSPDLKIFEEKQGDDSIGCSLCIYAAQLTDNFLKKNKTADEIDEELKMVCNYFPLKLGEECVAFITEYGPYVIQLIAADLDPKEVCTELKLCGDEKKMTSFDIRNKLRPSRKGDKRKWKF